MSVDEILEDYRAHHKGQGKGFEARAKKYEEFFDESKQYITSIVQHAHYVAHGKPTDLKKFPGAYNEAYKTLDSKVAADGGKLENDDDITKIVEKYVDTFLRSASPAQLDKALKLAKKNGLSDEDIRKMKGNMFARYHQTQEGYGINPLNDNWMKEKFKGKTKLEAIEVLKSLADSTTKTYASYLQKQALEKLFDEDDHFDMAEYFLPKFDAGGWKHDKPLMTFKSEDLYSSIQYLLVGSGESLQKKGFKRTPKKEE